MKVYVRRLGWRHWFAMTVDRRGHLRTAAGFTKRHARERLDRKLTRASG